MDTGYRRIWINGRLVMEHVLVWEAANGPIPRGHHVHHINEDKGDNRIENLVCVDPLTHKRIHSGCVLRDGEWFKPCAECREFFPVTDEHWYFVERRGYGRYPISGKCRRCYVQMVVARKSGARAARGLTTKQRERAAIAHAATARRAEFVEPWHETARAIGWPGTANGLRMLVKSKG